MYVHESKNHFIIHPYYSLSNLKLLIIDDDEALSKSIKFFFEDHECEVVVANNGQKGLEKFQQENPDIVLVDLNMPDIDGHYVIAEIKRSSPDIPIIVISGTSVIKEAIRSMNLGAWDFVTKPIMNFEELEMSVLRVLEKAFLIEENKIYKSNLEFLVEQRTDELEKKKSELEKVIDELKIAKEKAEQSDKLKTEFLAQVSHEIRTPLNIIVSHISLCQESIENNPDLKFINGFKNIKKASDRLIRTVEFILDMSELQAGMYDYRPQAVDIKQTLIEFAFNYSEKIKEKKLELGLNFTQDDTIANLDKYSFERIIENLIDNAYKFTHKGSIEINLWSMNDFYIVEIEDSGEGISEEYMKKLFTPFTQEDVGYGRRYEGNGLGLAMTKKFCSLNSIELKIVSKKNEGTNVKLYIKAK